MAPESRIVYVDNDPIVLSHAQALLKSSPQGACAYLDADLRDPDAILAAAAGTLDFSQPVAVMLIAVLHFVGEDSVGRRGPQAVTVRAPGALGARRAGARCRLRLGPRRGSRRPGCRIARRR